MKHDLTKTIPAQKEVESGRLGLPRNKVPLEVVGLGCAQWPLPRD